MTRTEALIALNLSMDIGEIRLQRLLEVFGSPEDIVAAAPARIAQVPGIGERIARNLAACRGRALNDELSRIARKGISIVTLYDEAYPRNLAYIVDKPIVLYIKGAIEDADALSLAMVGCRSPTYYGIEQAGRFASEFARRGITVISGLARGVDTCSHEGALKASGRTIAVIGSGLGNMYPPENDALAQRISQSGAVVSEFPVTEGPKRFHFPRRNRLISGLALGVLVIEAGRNSGSLITVHYALDQGRDVFALPGRIDIPQAYGTNALIRDGACPVTCIEDILDVLPAAAAGVPSGTDAGTLRKKRQGSLSCLESTLYNIMSCRPVSIEVLMEQTQLDIARLSQILLSLHMKQLITQVGAGIYIRSTHVR